MCIRDRIDAAALLDDPGIRFTILGEGSEHAALQKRIDARESRSPVTLAGHIDNPFPVIAGAGAFALTSVRESFGNVLVEALCLGAVSYTHLDVYKRQLLNRSAGP